MAKDNFFNWTYIGRSNISGIEKTLYIDHKYNVLKSVCVSSNNISGKILIGRTDIKYWHRDFATLKKKTEIELFTLLETHKIYVQERINPINIEHKTLFKINKYQ